jgi:replication factor A1
MSDQFKDLLNHILSQNPNIPVEQLLNMVERKKQESHGLLSDEGAIRLLAQQFSISLFPTDELKDQRIASVQAGLMDASITGEIISMGGIQEFRRSDESMGGVLRIRLADASGKITCVCWDSIAEFVADQGLGVGSRVRLEHGYTKYGRAGEVEFHLGSRSSVQLLSPPVLVTQKPSPGKVSGLSQGSSVDRLRLRIRALQTGRSEKAPVQALCEDETGLIVAKFWDESKEAALSIGAGKTVTVENAWVRERNGLFDLNIGRTSTVISEEFRIDAAAPTPIGSLKGWSYLCVVSGKVVERGEVREIETREGRRTRVSNIRIEDDTGRIRVSLWDKHAESVDTLRLGDKVTLTGLKLRRSPTGELEASTVFLTLIERN